MCVSNLWRRRVVVVISVEGFVCGQERDAGLHGSLKDVNEGQWLGGFPADGFEALLHRGDFVGMRGGYVVLFVRILGEVEEFDVGGKYRSLDELPIALSYSTAKRLDVIDELSAR